MALLHTMEGECFACTDPEGGGGRGGGSRTPLKNHKNIGFISISGPDPLKNHKATKPAFNCRPLSACQQNAISMAFAGGPMMTPFSAIWILFPLIKKRKMSELDPLWQTFCIRACFVHSFRHHRKRTDI